MKEKNRFDKKQALKDLCDLYYASGYHGGRWTHEFDMDDSAEEYLATMVMFAEKYKIDYDKNLSHYIEDEEYEAECYTMDSMADVIFQKVDKRILEILGVY